MKILWVSHFLLYPDTGYGALQRSRNLLLALCKGHEVYLVSYYRSIDIKNGISLEDAYRDLKTHCKEVFLLSYPLDRSKFNKYFTIFKSIFSSIPYSVLIYESSELNSLVLEMVKKFQIDFVHADTIGLIDRSLSDIEITKSINHHNIESDMMQRRITTESNPVKKLFCILESIKLKKYERKVCPEYDINIVVSSMDKYRVRDILGSEDNHRIEVIENGVDCDYFQYNDHRKASKELIFFGSLNWYPNKDAVVYFCQEVLPLLKRTHKDIKFTVIGGNPSKRLLDIIDREENISLLGYVKDIRPYVRKAKIMVCPIRTGGGTRLKILDALAQGIPVVSTEIGCEGLNLKDSEHILIANSPEEFVRQINSLLQNKDMYLKISKNGRLFVEENYSWKLFGDKMSRMFEEIVRGRYQ